MTIENTNAVAPQRAAQPGVVSPEVAVAQTTVANMRTDPAFIARFNSSDASVRAAALAESEQAHKAAYPGEEGTSDSYVQHDAPGATQVLDAPPPSPAGYKFDYDTRREVDSTADREIREVLHAAGLPQPLAKLFFDTYNREAGRVAALEAARLASTPWARETVQEADAAAALAMSASEFKLRQRFGSEYDEKIAAARSVIQSLPADKRATYGRLVKQCPRVGNDPLLLASLANFAQERARNPK